MVPSPGERRRWVDAARTRSPRPFILHVRLSRGGHHLVVDAVRAVRRLKPRIAAEVVRRALNSGRDAAGGQRRIDPAHRIRRAGGAAGGDSRAVRSLSAGTARGDTGVVGARGGGGRAGAARSDARIVGSRLGRGRAGRRHARAGHHADRGARGGGARGGPAAAVAAGGSVVVHGGGRVVRVVGCGRRRVVRARRVVGGRAVGSGRGRAFPVIVRRAAAVGVGHGRLPRPGGVI